MKLPFFKLFFNKSKNTKVNKCTVLSINECPYNTTKECNMDKSNCIHNIKNDNKKENKYTKILWLYLLIALLLYLVLTFVSENKNIEFEYSKLIYTILLSIILSIISGIIVSIIIDVPSRLKEYESSFINALTSNLYIKRLDERRLTNLRKEITSQLHKKNVPFMAKGLIDLDEEIMGYLKVPYYVRYRHTIICSDIENDDTFIKKEHSVEYKMVNPYGINKDASINVGFSTLLMIDNNNKNEYLKKLNLMFYCSIDNDEELDYAKKVEFKIFDLDKTSEFYNSKVVLMDKDTNNVGLKINFSDNITVRMYYTMFVSKNDKCYTERLRYPTKNYRLDYTFLNNKDIKLHGQIFGTNIKQSDISVRHINDNSLSLETFNWLLPENGSIVVS